MEEACRQMQPVGILHPLSLQQLMACLGNAACALAQPG